jgi:hypothetical protein
MNRVSPLLVIHSRRGRRAIAFGGLVYSAASIGLLTVAATSGNLGTDHSSLIAGLLLGGVALTGVLVYRKLRG